MPKLPNILNLIYPPVCGFCNKINKNNLCKKCELKIKQYEINKINDNTKDKMKHFDYSISVLKYENEIRKQIIEYKFGEKAYKYKAFAKIILNNKKICSFLEFYDIIIPVPMYKNKKALRGYNQTELIAKELGKLLNLHVNTKCLIKNRNTQVQSTLTKMKRQKNIKNAFSVKNIEIVKNKKVILFDDIYTTGSTVNECSRVLKEAGAKRVLALTLAKD